MEFEKHLNLRDKHAFLSPSSHRWLNYDDEKLDQVYLNMQAKEKGVKLHQLACDCITLGVKLPNVKTALNMFVNDAIGYRMTPEQPLYYSENCFGTADAIKYEDYFLRIHDLKTGRTPVSMDQLLIYAALFFLEYDDSRGTMLKKSNVELRIYQGSGAIISTPERKDISQVMGKIRTFDQRIRNLKGERTNAGRNVSEVRGEVAFP